MVLRLPQYLCPQCPDSSKPLFRQTSLTALQPDPLLIPSLCPHLALVFLWDSESIASLKTLTTLLCVSIGTESWISDTLASSSFLTYFRLCVSLMGEAMLSRAVPPLKKEKELSQACNFQRRWTGNVAQNYLQNKNSQASWGEGPGNLHFGKVPKHTCQ